MAKFKVVERVDQNGRFFPPNIVFENGEIKKTKHEPGEPFLHLDDLTSARGKEFRAWGKQEILKLFKCYCIIHDQWINRNNIEMDYPHQIIRTALQNWSYHDGREVPEDLRHSFLISLLQKAKQTNNLEAFKSVFNNRDWPEIPKAYAIAQYLNGYQGDVSIDEMIVVLNNQARMMGYETVDLNRQDNKENVKEL